jgi:oligosaccharide repeat unit polymerase
MIGNWGAALIAGMLLALVSGYARSRGGSWLEPGAFFALVWSFYVLLPLVFASDYTVWPGGVWWILASALSVCCGSWWVAGNRSKALSSVHLGVMTSTDPFPESHPLVRGLRPALLVSVFCGLLYSLIAVAQMGFDSATLLSLKGIVVVARAFSVDRYSEDYVAPGVFSQIWLIGVYAAPIFGGILIAMRRSSRDVGLSILSLSPALVVFALQTTRAAIVTGLILWVSACFAVRVLLERGKGRLFTKRVILAFCAMGVLMVVFFAVGQVMRGGDTPEVGALGDVLVSPVARASMLGHISVFSQWFHESRFTSATPALGAYSVAGLFDQLGLHSRPAGLYTDPYEVEPGAFTNIYTIFRGLIEDFTLPGSFVFLFLVGVCAGSAYNRVRKGNPRYLPFLVAFYAFSGSHGVSIFNYNSVLFAWLISGMYLWRTTIPGKRYATKQSQVPSQIRRAT